MKQIREFIEETEALMAKSYLEANGIAAHITGGREYSSIVAGGTQGRYFLSVDESQWNEAQNLLEESNRLIPEQIKHPTEIAEVALKKSVMFAVIACVLLPILGNWISIREAIKYARLERNPKKWAWLFVISWMQVGGVLVAWYVLPALIPLDF